MACRRRSPMPPVAVHCASLSAHATRPNLPSAVDIDDSTTKVHKSVAAALTSCVAEEWRVMRYGV